MKMGKFKDLAEKRFSKEKIAQMNREVALEAEAMRIFKSEKLWRDKVPAYCESNGSIITTRTLNDQEFDRELRKKCIEEAHEIQAAKDRTELLEELADMYELIDSLLVLHKIVKEEVIATQDAKRNEKGGFEQSCICDDCAAFYRKLQRILLLSAAGSVS